MDAEDLSKNILVSGCFRNFRRPPNFTSLSTANRSRFGPECLNLWGGECVLDHQEAIGFEKLCRSCGRRKIEIATGTTILPRRPRSEFALLGKLVKAWRDHVQILLGVATKLIEILIRGSVLRYTTTNEVATT
jgi:hypothetical protein